MATEAQLVTAVQAVVTLYPDQAPAGADTPYATYSQVGGFAENYQDGGAGDGGRHARIQFTVFSATRLQANSLIKQIEEVVKATPFFAEAHGAFVSIPPDPTGKIRGSRQDFSFWLF